MAAVDVDGYEAEAGVCTYTITHKNASVKRRFRDCIRLSDALHRADKASPPLPNPLGSLIWLKEGARHELRVETLKTWFASLPATAAAGAPFADFWDGTAPATSPPAKTAAPPTPPRDDADFKPPPSPTFSDTDAAYPIPIVDPSALRDFAGLGLDLDAADETAAAAAPSAGPPPKAAVQWHEPPAVNSAAPAAPAAPSGVVVARAAGDDDDDDAAASDAEDGTAPPVLQPPPGLSYWFVAAIALLSFLATTGATGGAVPRVPAPPPPPALEVLETFDLPSVEDAVTPVGGAATPPRLAALYDSYLSTPHREIKATLGAAATAGFLYRAR